MSIVESIMVTTVYPFVIGWMIAALIDLKRELKELRESQTDNQPHQKGDVK